MGQHDSSVTLIREASPERNNNTRATAAFMKGKYNTVGSADSAKNAHRGQVAKLIKEWENHRVGAALRELPCEPVQLILPDKKVERINNVKGNFKRKTLAVDIAAALILVENQGPHCSRKIDLLHLQHHGHPSGNWVYEEDYSWHPQEGP